MASYLKKIGKHYHFHRRVPKLYQKFFPKPVIMTTLKTDSQAVAIQRASNFNLILEDFWSDILNLDTASIEEKYHDMIVRSRMSGFQYRPKKEIIEQAPIHEFINRLKNASLITDNRLKQTVLGGVSEKQSAITLSKARDQYFEYEKGNLLEMSDNQLRKWKNPRKKAVKNFIQVVGNKPIQDITRKDILDFRNWWTDRIQNQNLAPNSANKEFGVLRRILSVAEDNLNLQLNVNDLFKRIAFKKSEKRARYPFSQDFINNVLLTTSDTGLNQEARLLVFAMADTGARIGELVGLEQKDICLDSTIPHIKIWQNETRKLKTPQSERDLPLVGASLYAFEQLGGTFERYYGKPDLVSNTINKYFRENNLLPSEHHSLYSLRHSFEDRLTSVEPPDKVQAALMGHKYNRPRYGDGPSLSQKKAWLVKIAFSV